VSDISREFVVPVFDLCELLLNYHSATESLRSRPLPVVCRSSGMAPLLHSIRFHIRGRGG